MFRNDTEAGTAIGVKFNIRAESVGIELKHINYTAISVRSNDRTVLVVSIYVCTMWNDQTGPGCRLE